LTAPLSQASSASAPMKRAARRSFDSSPAAKRAQRAEQPLPEGGRRLIDDKDALALVEDATAAGQAKTKGFLRSRNLTHEEWAELEVQLVEVIRDQAEGVFLSSEMLLAAMPTLVNLEDDSKAALIAIYERHMRYEEAARRTLATAEALAPPLSPPPPSPPPPSPPPPSPLLPRARHRHQAEHQKREADLRRERDALLADRKALLASHSAREDELQAEISRSAAAIEEAKKEAADATLRASEAEAVAEAAREEASLKRETSKALKEEVIENDRLTIANRNRIKALETDLDAAREEKRSLAVRAAEAEAVREVLGQREAVIKALMERLEAAAGAASPGVRALLERGQSQPEAARAATPAKSFFERLSASTFSGLSPKFGL